MRIVSGPCIASVCTSAPPRGLERELRRLIQWFNGPSRQLDASCAQALLTCGSVLHPYEDGNGRVGRAARHGACTCRARCASTACQPNSMVFEVTTTPRSRSPRAVRSTPARGWLLRAQVQSAAKASEVTGQGPRQGPLLMMHGGTSMNDRQRKAVNRLLDCGRGGFEGGMTNSKYQRLTGASRHRPARSRKLAEYPAHTAWCRAHRV